MDAAGGGSGSSGDLEEILGQITRKMTSLGVTLSNEDKITAFIRYVCMYVCICVCVFLYHACIPFSTHSHITYISTTLTIPYLLISTHTHIYTHTHINTLIYTHSVLEIDSDTATFFLESAAWDIEVCIWCICVYMCVCM